MNPIDFAVIIILILGFVWGFNKGFVYMVFSLLAILCGAFGAGKLVPFILPAIFPAKYTQMGYIVLFILIFTLIYFIIRKLSYLVDDMIAFLELEWLDSLLGGTIGLFQFLIILGVIITVLQNSNMINFIPNYQDLRFSYFIADISQKIIQFIAGNISSIRFK
jgi:uncharacterized membrane protein required for colicin V production